MAHLTRRTVIEVLGCVLEATKINPNDPSRRQRLLQAYNDVVNNLMTAPPDREALCVSYVPPNGRMNVIKDLAERIIVDTAMGLDVTAPEDTRIVQIAVWLRIEHEALQRQEGTDPNCKA
jgi:hypothetical protein